jgi:TorA maturation chaperone TorD
LNLTQGEKQSILEAVRIMSEFFWGPAPEMCQNLLQAHIWKPIEEILPRLDLPGTHPLDTVQTFLDSFSNAQALYDVLEEEYVRLFISNHQGVLYPLYASCYSETNPFETSPLMGEAALEMRERLKSAGLALADSIGEPPDHLAIELEYLYFLLSKGWGNPDPRLIEEAGSFVMTHMIPWVSKLHQGLTEGSFEGRFYPILTTLLVDLLRSIETLASGD